MKRSAYLWAILSIVALALVGGAAALAATDKPSPPQTGMGPGIMGGCLMGDTMGHLSVSGDGVYVLAGGRLLKYDKDLNLVKEIDITSAARPKGAATGHMMQKHPEKRGAARATVEAPDYATH